MSRSSGKDLGSSGVRTVVLVAVWLFAALSLMPFALGEDLFVSGGQGLGNSSSYDIALGDLDNDGDLDAVEANYYGQPNVVWLNDGSGVFSRGQSLSGSWEHDGDLDAFVTNWTGDEVWLNDGSGTFTLKQELVTVFSYDVALGDLDDDGDLDAFTGSSHGRTKTVWLNDGSGVFSLKQRSGGSAASGVALGDFDGDGDLDAFIANSVTEGEPDEVWLNDGTGMFVDSGLRLGNANSPDVALGDIDGDLDLDAVVACYGPKEIWLNTTMDVLQVTIHIKPGSDPNSINLKAKGQGEGQRPCGRAHYVGV